MKRASHRETRPVGGFVKLIVSVDLENEGLLLRKKLAPLLGGAGGLELVTTRAAGLAEACDENTVAALILTGSFKSPHREAFRRARQAGYAGPILIVAKLESPTFLAELQQSPNAHFLERPYDPRDLLGLVEKFRHDKEVSQRIHRRYPTQAAAEVEAGDERSRALVRNLSRGGAFLEVEEGPLPARGAVVVVKIALNDMRRSYSMPAKVVWVSPAGPEGRPSIGVEFTGPGDARRLLVGNG